MSFRTRLAFGIALFGAFMFHITAAAKGGFSFISITGPNLKEEVRSKDAALTRDFFAFANFYRDKTDAPSNPGIGFEITRYYLDGSHEIAFDSLHYYPETGYVYYDGIAGGGWSEYDDYWYIAKPEIRKPFESVLPGEVSSGPPAVGQPVPSAGQTRPTPSFFESQSISLMIGMAGLAALLALALRSRRLARR